MGQKKQLLIVGFVWPEPKSSAAGSRMMQLIRFFKKHGWDITFASTANTNRHTTDLDEYVIETRSIIINDGSFDAFVKELSPDAVLFDRFMTEEQFGWRVHVSCPDAIRILDMEDLHCLRFGRQLAVNEGRECANSDLFTDIAKREIASIYRCDLSLVISEPEMELLRTSFGVQPELLLYLPYMFEAISEVDRLSWPAFEQRSDFVSIGNFRHKPNFDSIEYLKEKIWPIIRDSLPDVSIHIYGAYPSQKIKQLDSAEEGFRIMGRAEDAREVMRNSRICLAPLRFGAGLKGKLTEAMQCGTPSITTTIGAEGIHGDLPWAGQIEDDPLMFAQAAIRYYTDHEAWSEAQQHGIRIINTRFSPAEFSQVLAERLDLIINDTDSHRENNFTGAMLMHHTMASTRFMSRWIEEKNKK
ncbi:glycosyltransferase [Rhodohalobacter sp. SW132]|uniref:glycosyltransferase n=1 Tax=Rhodohalobacter sp. SW132 TaxID=2293433 RepID=UPI000E2700D6|nr:glycosyltransferase [Rhodohalobacter sp. SW132]REL38159.1 glycosyltransferase [Rhodohalobacter sp. SW132]